MEEAGRGQRVFLAAVIRAARQFRAFNAALIVATTIVTYLILLPPLELSQDFLVGLVTLDGLLVAASAAIYSIAVRPLRRGFEFLRANPSAVRTAFAALVQALLGSSVFSIFERRNRFTRITRIFLGLGEFGIAPLALLPPFTAAVLALAALLRLPEPTTVILSVPGILTWLAVWVTIWHAVFLVPYLAWTIYTMHAQTPQVLSD